MMKTRYFVLLVLLSAALGIAGCADYYAGYPGYGPYNARPYYGGGSVVVAVGDRPYYRGPGYWHSGSVLRVEARTLALAERPAGLGPRSLRLAWILIGQIRSGGFPAAMGDRKIALP